MRIVGEWQKYPISQYWEKIEKKMILKIPNQDQRYGLAEYDIKWLLTIIEKPEQKLSSISFSVKDAELSLKILSQFWWMDLK